MEVLKVIDVLIRLSIESLSIVYKFKKAVMKTHKNVKVILVSLHGLRLNPPLAF